MTIDLLDHVLRMIAGVGLGALVGLERQWRARTAGVRTNALVALGAALFVELGALAFDGPGADPTRVAAQVVSGIGFLGAGVIMKQGASITGLNTAATLWASAAVGALSGSGMYLLAGTGTAVIMLANTLLRPLGRVLDRRAGTTGREQPPAEYRFVVQCPTEAETAVRSLVFDAVHRDGFTVLSIDAEDVADGVRIAATILSAERNDAGIEEAIAEVIREPAVTAVRWSAQELPAAD
ncbi:MgtC/SapB family protein [Microbacterium sp.]|uniref:MgtC/SapB family protein n=1 Tax=Microbacterium sp. TaxID=51671 RepID=UPI003340C96D